MKLEFFPHFSLLIHAHGNQSNSEKYLKDFILTLYDFDFFFHDDFIDNCQGNYHHREVVPLGKLPLHTAGFSARWIIMVHNFFRAALTFFYAFMARNENWPTRLLMMEF